MICPTCKTPMLVIMKTRVEGRSNEQYRCEACGYSHVETFKRGGYGFSVRGGGTPA